MSAIQRPEPVQYVFFSRVPNILLTLNCAVPMMLPNSHPSRHNASYNRQLLNPTADKYGRRFNAMAKSWGLTLWEVAYRVALDNLDHFRDTVHFDTPLLRMARILLEN